MKTMMSFEIVQPVCGAFQTEAEGWEHADQIANGRAVRLVQSRQVDQDKTEVADLRESAWDAQIPEADNNVVAMVAAIVLLTAGFIVGVFVGGAL